MGIVLHGGPHDSSVARAWPTTRAFGGRGPYCCRIPLVRTSSELAVRRPGKAPEGAVPSPSPGRHAATRSRRGSSSSSPPTADGFGTGTPVPSPQSQSFSRGYGSILPTSLAYIVPSTRGCSPWRPDAVMSTTGRGRHSVLRIFKGRRGRTGHRATCEKITLPEAPADVSGLPNVAVSAQFGTVTRLPVHPASPVLLTKNGPLGALDSVARLNEAAVPSYLFKGDPANQLPCALRVYSPVDSHTCQTPWSVFQDGPNGVPTGRCREHACISPRRRVLPTTIDATASPRAYRQLGLWPPHQSAPVHAPSRSADRLSPFHIRPGRIAGPHSLPSRQFQALFDSLFKVLFIFPSRYLFAIGLTPVFSLGRNLPPYWGCIPKQLDSQTAPRGATGSGHDGALTLSGAPFQGTWARSAAEDASPDYNSDSEAARFSSWADPGSLAVTKGILVHVHGSFCFAGFDNDPSAGSPTETLLRLLLPLNDKVQWNSRDVAGGEPPTSPRS
ncbi:hypothetical protein L2E82_53869 [Cichorium intybus]|nr:hypothetical protein L2E82_53869 [Cichorium intybus]